MSTTFYEFSTNTPATEATAILPLNLQLLTSISFTFSSIMAPPRYSALFSVKREFMIFPNLTEKGKRLIREIS